MAIIKISFHLNMEAQLVCGSLSYGTGEILERCILYISWAISHSNQKSIVTFKFHRPPRMSVMLLFRGSAPIGGSFYLANHPLFDKTIDSTLFCSHNEMHFKYYAFWSSKTFFISMIRAPGLRISCFSTLRPSIGSSLSIYRSVQLYREN